MNSNYQFLDTYIINTWSFIQDSLVGFIGNVVFVIIK